jgi:hypothetical protein
MLQIKIWFTNWIAGMWTSPFYLTAINVRGTVSLIGSFRLVPTFGADTIRRFSNNVSELKKLAARDFEDLLQVRRGREQIKPVLKSVPQSVLYRFSMVFFLNHTIPPFCNYSLFAHIGMGWLSFGCIRIRRSRFWIT